MSIGERINARLRVLNISQSELARRTGLAQSTINTLINRDTRSSPHLMKLAAALRTTPAYLLEETDEPDSEVGQSALSVEERELLDVTRQLGREDFNVLTYIARKLLGGDAPGAPPVIDDRGRPIVNDRRLRFKAS